MFSVGIGLAIGGAVIVLFLLGYVKAKPNEALIISGFRSEPRIVTGRSAVRIPFLERIDRLDLSMIQIDVKTGEPVKNTEFIDVSVDAVATVKISSESELIGAAMKNFLNQRREYIAEMIRPVLEGNIREIIGQLTLQQMVQDTKAFADKVQENAVDNMNKMGITIISFNIQNFDDSDGILRDLGMDNTMKIRKEASIVKAIAEKEIEVAKSEANKESNDARVRSEQDIAEKNNELDIRQSELKKLADIKKAEAAAAYAIQEQTQRKNIETTTAEADLERATKIAEVKEQEVLVARQTLAAEIEAKAKSERIKAQEEADARAYELRKQADAQRYADEETAKGIKAKALAEAEGIKAKGLAEAAAIDKKADAMKKYGEAAIAEMYFNSLPSVASALSKPLENIGSITMYGEGNTNSMVGDITKSLNQVMNGANEGLGIDIKSLLSGVLGGKIAQNNSPIVVQTATSDESTTDAVVDEVN